MIKSTLSKWVSSGIKDSCATLAPNNVAVGNFGLVQPREGGGRVSDPPLTTESTGSQNLEQHPGYHTVV